MSLVTYTAVPSTFEAGDTLSFTEPGGSNYPPGAWTATLVLNRAGRGTQSFTGTTSGSAFGWTLTTAQTALIAPGTWTYAIYVSDGTQRATLKTGTIGVLQNLAVDATPSPAQVMLTALESAITKLSGSVNQIVNFNGQSFTKSNLGDLLKQRVQLKAEIYREQQALAALRGTAQSGFIGVRFARQYPNNQFCNGWNPTS